MGDGVLFGRFHLRGRELLAGFDGTRRLIVGHEQRVVAEALVPGLTVDDAPFDDVNFSAAFSSLETSG